MKNPVSLSHEPVSSPKTPHPARARHVLLATLVLIGGILRFAGVDGDPEDWDAIDFLLGVQDFDLIGMQPHLPGYPLHMLLARLVCLVVPAPALALEVLGAAAGTLTVVLAYRVVSSWTDPFVALQVAALLAVQPALVAEAPRMHSDTLGLLIVLLGVLFVARKRSFAGGVCSGLSLGVRLAYAPLLVGMLLFCLAREKGDSRRRDGPRSEAGGLVSGVMVGLAAWGVPFLVVHGPEILSEAGSFIRGHFLEWGGTPLAVDSPGVIAGAMSWLGTLARVMTGSSPESYGGAFVVGLAGVLVLAGCVLCGLRKPGREVSDARRATYWLILPYAAWLLVGQNPESFRHALPLVPFLTTMVAAGWNRRRAGSLAIGAVVCLYAASTIGFLVESRGVPAPGDALAKHLLESDGKGNKLKLVYCGASYRFLRWRGVHYQLQVARVIDFSGAIEDINSRPTVPEEVLVGSDVGGIPAESLPVISFTAPGFLEPLRLELHRFLTRRVEHGLHELLIPDAESK